MYWQWNDFDPNEAVYYSRTVEGEYIRPVTTISTGEDEPLFLAEGTFRDGQTLLAVPFVPDAETLGIDAASILAAYTVRVSRLFRAPHRAHAYLGVRKSLYTLRRHAHAAFVHPRRQLYCFPAGQRRIDRVPCAGNLPYRLDHWRHCGRRRSRCGGRPDYRAKKKKKDLTSS